MQKRHIFIVLALFLALLLVMSFVVAEKQCAKSVAKDDPFAKCVTKAIQKTEKCLLSENVIKQAKCKDKAPLNKCIANAKAKGFGKTTGSFAVDISSLGGTTTIFTIIGLLAILLVAIIGLREHRRH